MYKQMVLSVMLLGGVAQVHADSDGDDRSAIKFITDNRLRYEFVDQSGFEDNAKALTFRSRYALETKKTKGFSLLVEGESVFGLVTDFNSLRNGETNRPVVADATNTELNRAQIAITAIDGAKVTVGRQRIILGNSRFVGNVGFRQNEQTFDAVRLDVTAIDTVTATYAYMDQVNRIFGDGDDARGRFHGDIHALDVSWKPHKNITVKGYGLFLDLDEAAALSTSTIGGRVEGKFSSGFGGAFEYANQKDQADNPFDLNLDYWTAEAGYQSGKFSIKAVIETLEGDGNRGFSTPLATLHKFQGFADVFLATPADGIQDIYGQATVKLGDFGVFKGVTAAAWYHDFEAENGGRDLGDEIDLRLAGSVGKLNLAIKFASYNGVTGIAGRDKLWLTVGFKI